MTKRPPNRSKVILICNSRLRIWYKEMTRGWPKSIKMLTKAKKSKNPLRQDIIWIWFYHRYLCMGGTSRTKWQIQIFTMLIFQHIWCTSRIYYRWSMARNSLTSQLPLEPFVKTAVNFSKTSQTQCLDSANYRGTERLRFCLITLIMRIWKTKLF